MADIADVAFEVSDVDRVEANLGGRRKVSALAGSYRMGRWLGAYDGDPKPDVGFGKSITDEEFLALENLLDFI